MKFIVVADEKPKKCKECPFQIEHLAKTEMPNTLNLEDTCILGGQDNEHCPITEVHTLFVKNMKESEET